MTFLLTGPIRAREGPLGPVTSRRGSEVGGRVAIPSFADMHVLLSSSTVLFLPSVYYNCDDTTLVVPRFSIVIIAITT
jgi:hypothetical protein